MSASGVKRRDFLAAMSGGAVLAAAPMHASMAAKASSTELPSGADDRSYMLDLLERMATPVLDRMSQGRLHEWKPELSASWDGRNPQVAYLEAFGRLIDGIAPWLALPDDSSPEGRLRAKLRTQALASYTHAVDPQSPDYLFANDEGQALVDSAFFCSALLRAPDVLWKPLDAKTRQRIVARIQDLRSISPPYTNWLLFAAINEAFLLTVGAQWDPIRIELAVRKFNEWYVGDGWYADGVRFHFDMYNSYVIHPFLSAITEIIHRKNGAYTTFLEKFRQRDGRYAVIQERLVNADGSFPVTGRSVVYRGAAFQHLADMAWRQQLPVQLKPAQVRCALTAVLHKTMDAPGTYTKDGWLNIGVCGSQPEQADYYNTTGSLYLCSVIFLPLGLPDTDVFWTSPPEQWTAQKIWSGQDVSGDHSID